MDEEEDSPVKVRRSPRKRKLLKNENICYICQKPGHDDQSLCKPGVTGKRKFIEALERRRLSENFIHHALLKDVDINNHCLLPHIDNAVTWHKHCYSSFTSTRNLSFVTPSVVEISSSSDTVNGKFKLFRHDRLFIW